MVSTAAGGSGENFHHAEERGLDRLNHYRCPCRLDRRHDHEDQEGIVVTILVGIVGALIGGFLLSFFVDTASGGWWFTLFTAILGAVVLLWLFRLVRRA